MSILGETLTQLSKFGSDNIINNNRFIVTIGPLLTSFAKVSGIGRSIEYESREEGGRNDFVHLIRKNPSLQSNTLRLEKGVGRFNPLILSANGMIKLGVKIPLPGTIIVLNNNNDISKVYGFGDITIVKWEISDLDAQSSEVLLDKVELIHSGLVMIGI
ncbi:MAG: conserved hypothetical phage tail region protein [Clostridiaceae bacterium]|nr:conserved hypothetical phage tail region protein [Clostridiaceae bacterium]